jgi:exosortase
VTNQDASRAQGLTPRANAREATTITAMLLAVTLGTLVGWWHWVVELLRLAYSNEQYTHVVLVFPISVALAFLEARAKGIKPNWSPFPAVALVFASVIVSLIARTALSEASEIALVAGSASLVVFWIGFVMLFLGVQAVQQLLFPLLLLFLIVPVPQFMVDKCIVGLQVASLEAVFTLFRWAGVPVLKNGFILTLPALEIEVAQQCSGIRSSLVLLISSLVLGHLYLRSRWGVALLVAAAIPITIAKNAVRIFTLSMLGMNVNPAFLYGRLHRNGGVVFFTLALVGVVGLIKVLRQAENWMTGRQVRRESSAVGPR